MYIFRRNVFLLFLLFGLLVLPACIDKELDFDNIKSQNWNSIWAIPLVNSILTLEDFITDTTGIINEDETGLVTLVYESEELISYRAEEFIDIPDQEKLLNEEFVLPDTTVGATFSVDVPFSFLLELDEPGLRIDSSIMKNGVYRFTLSTNLNKSDARVDVIVPNIVYAGTQEPLQFGFDLYYGKGIKEIVKDTLIDLIGYSMKFEDSQEALNELLIYTTVTVVEDGSNNLSPYFLTLNNSFEDLLYSRLFGYVGQEILELQDTVMINIFAINEDGYFSFGPESVGLELEIMNSFGLPVLIDIERFQACRGGSNPDSVDIYIFGEGNPSVIDLNYPTINNIGGEALTQVISTTSNINEALEISPDKLLIELKSYLNPDGDTTLYNFVLDTSEIRANMTLSLELFGGVNGFKVVDTADFTLEQLDEINALQFVVDIENGFPINAIVQIEFVDSVYNVLHSLLPPNDQLMIAGITGGAPDYKVISPSQKTTFFEMDRDQLESIAETKKVIISAVFSTNEGQLVKIFSDYSIDLKLGAKVELIY
ncbi:MAG: hypothetical protein R2764_06560 [Bacteroidales bacterium]